MSFNDSQTPYAYARIHGTHQWGHLEVMLRNLVDEGLYKRPFMRISCQIGGEGEGQCEQPYAWTFTMGGHYDTMSLEEMEAGIKTMRSISRKVNKMNEEFGSPQTFAEYCSRIVIASGVEYVFFNKAWGGGYRQELTDLPTVRPRWPGHKDQLRTQFAELVEEMAKRYRRMAA